ncbi:hypothetical protein RLF25_02475, partial [Streptococcus pneumoniae]|nr:hypothetical protein [Streptococcus pneumoniae]
KKHPLGEKRNHPGSKLRQGFWMVFRFGVNNWGKLTKIFSILTKRGSNFWGAVHLESFFTNVKKDSAFKRNTKSFLIFCNSYFTCFARSS